MTKTAAIIASCTTLEKQLDVKPTQLGKIMGLQCKVKEYKRYEQELEEEISREGLKLFDYIQAAKARTEAFEEMLGTTRQQREKIEELLAKVEKEQKEREPNDPTRKSSLSVKDL